MHSGTNSPTTEVSVQFDNISCNQYFYMVAMFITFMVLYSIIKPYNSFFVINRHIARRDFILNDLFCGGRNLGKIFKFTSQSCSTSIAMMSHKHK